MPKATHKSVKFSPEEMAYELPEEIDIAKLRFVGKGVATVEKLARRSKRIIGLDADVARVFRDSESVNTVLRSIIKGLAATRRRRKSA